MARHKYCKKPSSFGFEDMQNYYERFEVAKHLSPYVRSFYLADRPAQSVKIVSPPTGYPVIGHVWRGLGQVLVDGKAMHPVQLPVNIFCGQLEKVQAEVNWQGGMGHALVEMTATGLFELFGLPGARLVNKALPGQIICPDFDACMMAAFSTAHADTSYQSAFEDVLTRQIDKAGRTPVYISEAVRQIEANEGAIKLKDLLRELSVNEHAFNKEFKSIVGLSPKYFCRIVQFNSVARIVLSGDPISNAALAAEAGYYDQSHFTKAFHEFVSTSPAKFLSGDYANVSTFLRELNTQTHES